MENCQNYKHLGKQIDGFCSQVNCKSNLRTFCDKCKENHIDHLQGLQQLDQITHIKIENQQNINQLGVHFKNLQEFMLPLYEGFVQIDQNINQDFDYQNQHLLSKQVELMLTTQSTLKKILPICMNIVNSQNEIVKEFDNLKKSQNSQSQQKQTEIKKKKISLKQDMKFEQLNQKQILQQSSSEWQDLKIQFSQQFKYKWIKILNNGLRAENEDDRGIVICEPMLPKQGKYKFAFGINENSYLIWIGICHKEIVINNNYTTEFDKFKHKKSGVYLINNYGITNSHIDSELNNQTNSFFFQLDDLIVVYVDMDVGKITWESKKSQNKYTMKFDKRQDIHPCAGITAFSPIFIVENY